MITFPESSEASLRCMTESCHLTHICVHQDIYQMCSPYRDAILYVVEENKQQRINNTQPLVRSDHRVYYCIYKQTLVKCAY